MEIEALTKRLRFFSPEVECSRDEPGTFWLGATGLGGSCTRSSRLGRVDPERSAAGGLRRARRRRLLALRAMRRRAQVWRSRSSVTRKRSEQPSAAFRSTGSPAPPTSATPWPGSASSSWGGFLDLPPSGIRRRFGEAAFALHRRARGETWAPLVLRSRKSRTSGTSSSTIRRRTPHGSLHAIEGDLAALLQRDWVNGIARSAVWRSRSPSTTPGLPNGGTAPFEGTGGQPSAPYRDAAPGDPTRDIDLLLDLLRLRLESIVFPSGAVDVRLEAEFVGTRPEQMALFAEQHRRDLKAANRASGARARGVRRRGGLRGAAGRGAPPRRRG